MAQGDEEPDGATVVASPSFDEMLAARGESYDDGMTAVDARSYDEQVAAREAAKSHDPTAFAATASGPSYDARLEAMGLPVPGDDPPLGAPWPEAEPPKDPSVPKTMVLSPQAWGLPPAAPQPSSPAQPAGPQQPSYAHPPSYGQAPSAPSYAAPQGGLPHAQPWAASAPAPSRRNKSLLLFALSAGVTLLVFGSCGAAILAYYYVVSR